MSESLLPGRTPAHETEEGTQVFTDQPPQPIVHSTSPCEPLIATDAVPPEECARIIERFAPAEWDVSRINAGKQGGEVNAEIRNSKHHLIEFSPESEDLFYNIFHMVQSANLQHFHFDINYFDAIQLTGYDEGDFYKEHADVGTGTMGNRKLSVTVQLTSPDEYEGGDLVLAWGSPHFHASRELGSATIFPSFLRHKVETVTKGTRYSLVCWVSGNHRFK